jgi:hypothetical protein
MSHHRFAKQSQLQKSAKSRPTTREEEMFGKMRPLLINKTVCATRGHTST